MNAELILNFSYLMQDKRKLCECHVRVLKKESMWSEIYLKGKLNLVYKFRVWKEKNTSKLCKFMLFLIMPQTYRKSKNMTGKIYFL